MKTSESRSRVSNMQICTCADIDWSSGALQHHDRLRSTDSGILKFWDPQILGSADSVIHGFYRKPECLQEHLRA